MAYNTTASLDKSTSTENVDSGKIQDKFGQLSWSKVYFEYSDVKFRVFQRDDNRYFRLVQNRTMGEGDFTQFNRIKNQLVNGSDKFGREETFQSMLILRRSQDKDDPLILAEKMIDVVDRAKIMTCVTLLRYNVEKPESSYARVRLFSKKKEDEKFQQNVCVKQ